MNDQSQPLAGQPGLPPFPVWPPPSGGAPVTKWETGPIAGSPAPGRTFPAGAFIDGLGTVITPTRVIGGLGN
jgi:hypothetical protein